MNNDLGYRIDRNKMSLRPKNAFKLTVKRINLIGSSSWFKTLTNKMIYPSASFCFKPEGRFIIEKIKRQPIIVPKINGVIR